MSDIQIKWVTDSYDCETCGYSYAEGAVVTIDGVEAISMLPAAHCYDGMSYTDREVYDRILEHLGHTVSAHGDMPE